MSKFRPGLPLLLASFLCAGYANADSDTRNGLRIEAEIGISTVRLGSDFELGVALTNTMSGKSIVLPRQPGFGPGEGLTVEILASAGPARTVPTADETTTGSDEPVSPGPVTLLPGHSIGLFRSGRVAHFFDSPGRYKLRVRYSFAGGYIEDQIDIEVRQD